MILFRFLAVPLATLSVATSAGAVAAQGAFPDLTVAHLDRSAVTGDWQSLQVGGYLAADVANQGDGPTDGEFKVTVYADGNGNGLLDRGIDVVFGEAVAAGLAADEERRIQIPLSGAVSFRDDLMYAFADSDGAIVESDEANNASDTGRECAFRPPSVSFQPRLEWEWNGSATLPQSRQVIATPAVIDLDGDRVPDVVFVTFTGQQYWTGGHLRAVRGDTGREIFTVTDRRYDVAGGGGLAVGDIDGDGLPEIIAVASVQVATGAHNVLALLAFENDGTFKWRSPSIQGGGDWGGAALVDLEADGTPEIVVGNTVLNADGTVRWAGPPGDGRGDNWNGPLSLAADLDADGRPEIVAGNTAYRADGTIYWNANIADGLPAVGNFNDDPYPEVVLVSAGQVHLLSHDGRRLWGPVTLPGGTDRGAGGAPTIADMDGDGRPEVGVAGGRAYVVIDTNGRTLWSQTTHDMSSGVTGSSVFDFESDGSAEVVYGDEYRLRVYRGTDGRVLWDVARPDCTGYDMPIVADVDGDGKAEIVSVSNNYGYPGSTGVQVYGEPGGTWVATRRIWNQHTYHVDNVNDDGTIPRVEVQSWQTHNTYRANRMTAGSPFAAADATASRLTLDPAPMPTGARLAARIGSGGAIAVPGGMPVAFYAGSPAGGGKLVGVARLARTLRPGEWVDVEVAWDTPPIGPVDVYVRADDDGSGRDIVKECDEGNNTHSAAFVLALPPTATAVPTYTATPAATATATAGARPTDVPRPTASPTGVTTETRAVPPPPTSAATATAPPTSVPQALYLPRLWKDPPATKYRLVDAVLAIDASGSMTGAKLDAAKEGARALAQLMHSPEDRAAVVAFNEEGRLLVPLNGESGPVLDAIAAITASPGTRIDRGLAECLAEIHSARHRADAVPVVFVLSDGGQTQDATSAASVAAIARAQGVAIYAIGLGADVDAALLMDVAGAPDRYFFSPSAGELAALYKSISGRP